MAGPPDSVSGEGASGVGRGGDYCGDWLVGLFGKMAGRSGMHSGEARKPTPKTRQPFALGLGLQARIESVFSSLSGQFQVEETRARSVWGVMTRVVSKATVLHG